MERASDRNRLLRAGALLPTFLVLGALMLSGSAQAVELAIPDLALAAGQIAAVPITISSGNGLAALQMRLEFDGDAIEVVDVVPGPALANALVDFSLGKGSCAIALAATDPVTADGELLTLKVRRIGGANGASALRPDSVRAWNGADGRAMDISIRAGRIAALNAAWADWRDVAAAMIGMVLVVGVAVLYARRRAPQTVKMAAAVRPTPRPGPASSPNFCAICGTHLPQGANYCPNCGTKIVIA